MALAAVVFDRRLTGAIQRVDRRVRRGNARETRAALPALVDAVAAALASGLSLPVALAEVAPTLPQDLAAPTRRAASALVLGAPVGEALAAYAGAVPDEDIAPLAAIREQIRRGIDLVVHQERGEDGRRRIVEIAELGLGDGDGYEMRNAAA